MEHSTPARNGRRVAGLATLVSSAGIVGYMVTASADQQSSQVVIATTTAPTTTVTLPTPVTTPPTRTRQIQQAQPDSSTHGS